MGLNPGNDTFRLSFRYSIINRQFVITVLKSYLLDQFIILTNFLIQGEASAILKRLQFKEVQ